MENADTALTNNEILALYEKFSIFKDLILC